MSGVLSKEEIDGILFNVPMEKRFRFHTAEGQDTNVTAISLEDFAEKLIDIDVASIDFHYPRGDFQKWIKNTLEDTDLADRIELTTRAIFSQQTISLEELRYSLRKIIEKRIAELQAT